MRESIAGLRANVSSPTARRREATVQLTFCQPELQLLLGCCFVRRVCRKHCHVGRNDRGSHKGAKALRHLQEAASRAYISGSSVGAGCRITPCQPLGCGDGATGPECTTCAAVVLSRVPFRCVNVRTSMTASCFQPQWHATLHTPRLRTSAAPGGTAYSGC